jgi:hypothetical protein
MPATGGGCVPGARWLPSSMGASNMPVERARVTVRVAVEVGVRAAHWQRSPHGNAKGARPPQGGALQGGEEWPAQTK